MMKKFLIAAQILLLGFGALAQTVADAKRNLNDGRMFAALDELNGLVSKSPGDAEAIYWKGQALLAQRIFNSENLQKVRDLYSTAITATNQNPLIVVGMGHVEMLEKKEAQAKAHFDAALAATGNKKNKKYGDPEILKAILRAVADGDSKTGDVAYAIQKGTQLEEIGADPESFTNLGVIYLKGGAENGGLAKRAFEKALALDPNWGAAYYRIGRIFESQKNTELFLEQYNKGIAVAPKFTGNYYRLYEYYKNRDVNKAKGYLEGFLSNSDKNIENEFFAGDFLFRAGKYNESLQKAKEIEAGLKGEKFPKLYLLYAYNYDRLKDSLQALHYMEKYMAEETEDRKQGDAYSFMSQLYLKIPGNLDKADGMTEKAVAMDTVVDNKLDYMRSLANAYAAQSNWQGQYKWLDRMMEIRSDTSARNLFFIADAAHKAGEFKKAVSWADVYTKSYPEQTQGYYLKVRSATAADTDTSLGTAIPIVDEYISFLSKDIEKNKGRIISQQGYKVYYYLVKSQQYDRALEAANAILAVDPTNSYGQMAKTEAERLLKATGGRKAMVTPPKQKESDGNSKS